MAILPATARLTQSAPLVLELREGRTSSFCSAGLTQQVLV